MDSKTEPLTLVGNGTPVHAVNSDPLHWAFSTQNAAAVSGWAFWIGVLGLLISLLGFWATLTQLKKAKSEIKIANDEAERIRLSLNKYDAAQEASKASYALQTARKYFGYGAWINGSESYEDFRKSLLTLKINAELSAELDTKKIDDAIFYISKLCEKIDRDHQKGISTVDYVKAKSVMRDHDQLITEITVAIQRKAF